MIITKLWIYDRTQTENKGTEYSSFLLSGDTNTDNLDDTLDEATVTLVGLNFRKEFSPSTKIILEKGNLLNGVYTAVKTYNYIVKNDTVEQPILNEEYYNHTIDLIEVGALAQQRMTDNIAITYKLQDVTLDVVPTYSTTDTVSLTKKNVNNANVSSFDYANKFEWEMPTWYDLDSNGVVVAVGSGTTPSWNTWNNFLLNQIIPTGSSTKTIILPLPMLKVSTWNKNTNSYVERGYCKLKTVVTRVPKTNLYATPESVNLIDSSGQNVPYLSTFPSMATTNESWRSQTLYNDYEQQSVTLNKGYIASRIMGYYNAGTDVYGNYHNITQVTDYNSYTTYSNRAVKFLIEEGYKYTISVLRMPMTSTVVNSGYFTNSMYGTYAQYDTYPFGYSNASYSSTYVNNQIEISIIQNSGNQLSDNFPNVLTNFISWKESEDTSQLFTSASIPNAYDLFNKAQITTYNSKKIKDYSCYETSAESGNSSFYVSNDLEQELKTLEIVENFYNRKNFWEILSEIGKYIHGRPICNFGDDDRFIVDFKRYGRTDQKTDNSTKASIYNSRFFEEYISSINSYVSNMVQLGGIITEYINAKSNDETFLVCNDNAVFKTTKPITEIIDFSFRVKGSSTWYSLVGNNSFDDKSNNCGFIFEYNIYKCLSVVYTDNINKGLAIYYKLGSKLIEGLTYRTPTVSSGDVYNDYAIKKILYTIMFRSGDFPEYTIQTSWNTIKVNDYDFKIVYRTKDSVRSTQSRPDLRKYLINSYHDKTPLHTQFNNQEDTMVDAQKFGNNNYGKLIRTGNSIIKKLEWVDNLENVKKSGDLYYIQDNLYYVSKVQNQYFADHIESSVEFSKDFNRLSQIIGIPSEPRFYEISEQSLINREIVYDNFYTLDTSREIANNTCGNDLTLNGLNYMGELLFGNASYPRYAITTFKGDENTGNEGSNLFIRSFFPTHTYAQENTLIIEWDCEDNFSVGSYLDTTQNVPSDNTVDGAYRTEKQLQYCDQFGRVDLIDFSILDDYSFSTGDDILLLPNVPSNLTREIELANISNYADTTTFHNLVTNTSSLVYAGGTHFWTNNDNTYGKNGYGLITLKDNREQLSFNYNLQMLTSSDRFVLSSYLWEQEKSEVYLAFGNKEVNKIIGNSINNNQLITGSGGTPILIPITWTIGDNFLYIDIPTIIKNYYTSGNVFDYEAASNLLDKVSSIVFVNNRVSSAGENLFVFARNVSDLDNYTTCDSSNLIGGENTKISELFIRATLISDFKEKD